MLCQTCPSKHLWQEGSDSLIRLRYVLCCLALLVVLEGAACREKAEAFGPGDFPVKLVRQPFRDVLPFHVYTPSFLSSPWYLTAEGFPVVRLPGGLWVYGSVPRGKNPKRCVSTGIVVGSVVPSSVGLLPLAEPLGLPHEEISPAASWAVRSARVSLPSWVRQDAFYELLKRRDAVDRVGLFSASGLPVAWKGEAPKVLYFWTGKEWKNLLLRQGETPGMALERASYRVVSSSKGLPWGMRDETLLKEKIQARGYLWMGGVE